MIEAVTKTVLSAKKILLIALSICLFVLTSSGQSDFIRTDTSAALGIKLINAGTIKNCIQVKQKIGVREMVHSPNDLVEYGFKSGDTYYSKEIQLDGRSRRVFLLKLVDGTNKLFYYASKNRKAYFLEQDGMLLELSKKGDNNYRQILSERFSACPNFAKAVQLAKFGKWGLIRLVELGNQCNGDLIPYSKLGIQLGLIGTRYSASSQNATLGIPSKNLVFDYDQNISLGAFFDHPIQVSNFSIYVETTVGRSVASYYERFNDTDLDIVVDIFSLNVPVLFRYNFQSNRLKPFVNFGGVYSYLTKNDTQVYTTSIGQNDFSVTNHENLEVLNDHQLGLAGGVGLSRNVSLRKALFLELRYSQFLKRNKALLQRNQLGIIFGLNF